MGNKMGPRNWYAIIMILLYVMPLIPVAQAAINNDTDPTVLIGDPVEGLKDLPSNTQNKVKMLLTLLLLTAIIVGAAALIILHTKTSAGAAVGSAGMRNEGLHGIGLIIFVTFALIIGMGIFWWLMTGGF